MRTLQDLGDLGENPARPLVAVLGGAKVSDKIAVIERFLQLADTLLIGGAMCFPFLIEGKTLPGVAVLGEIGTREPAEAVR